MFLSKVTVSAEQPDQLIEVLQADHYQLHQLLWKLFPESGEKKQRDFLFRRDESKGFPVFYVLSISEPRSVAGVLEVETKSFNPQLKAGDRLRFSLRANPVEQLTQERSEEETRLLQNAREKHGLRDKTTKKRIRHDVVIHLKKTLLAQGVTKGDLPSQAELGQMAGEKWLQQRAEKSGFKLISVIAEGYQQHHFKKRKIKLSTLDFQGVLEVTDPELFIKKAFYDRQEDDSELKITGIGPAKAFGCGLLSVARI